MTHSASAPQLGSEFNDFLFALVGDDRNGMRLSVLSALARLDVDPWEEAANLTRLPAKTAPERLTSLIAALPDRLSARRDPATIAARLIGLLPRGAASNVPRQALLVTDAATNFHAVTRVIFINAILVAFMLGAQWLAISHQMLAREADVQMRTSQSSSVQAPTSNSGQTRSKGQ
jgi:hypothetical protein